MVAYSNLLKGYENKASFVDKGNFWF